MSRTATVILAIVCVAAGAGGSFLALRSDSPVTATEQVQAPASALSAVAESEGVIEPVPVAVPAAPVVAEPARVRGDQFKHRRHHDLLFARRRPASRAPELPVPAPPVIAPDQRVVPIAPAAITDNQASRTVEPPAPLYEELVVAADSVIGLQLESPVTSEKAQVEDSVVARVTRDVKVGDRVAIPAGAKALGEVTLVERGGKMRDRARLGVKFTSVVLADGTRLPLHTETIFREGDPPGRESAAKIGGGAIGAPSSEAFWAARRVRRLADRSVPVRARPRLWPEIAITRRSLLERR